MGLVWSANFTNIISSYRLLWISGRFGGHKTSLAYEISRAYLDRGYRLISNNRSVWADDIEKIKPCEEHGQLHAIVLLDEGGLSFKSSRQVEMIASYARKMDVIYIIPSFWPPSRAAQILICQPVFNFKSAGIPLIVYKWRVKLGSFQDNGMFFWYDPSPIYGIYSTTDPGDTSEKIVSFLIEQTEKYRLRFGYEDSLSNVEITSTDQFSDTVAELSAAVDEMATIPIRKGKRRRF